MAVTIAHIKAVVAEKYGLTPSLLEGHGRTRNVCRARQIAMALTRELTGLSYPQIGAKFGGRDHTSALFGVRKAADHYGAELIELREIISAQPSPCVYFALWKALADRVILECLAAHAHPPTPVLAPPPRFVPRKVRPARMIQPAIARRNVTGFLLGDPGHESARIARGETSVGVD